MLRKIKSRSNYCHQGPLFGFLDLNQAYDLGQIDSGFDTIERIAHTIFDQLEENSSGVRLLGVTLTGLEDQEGRQLDLDDLESL